MQTLEDEELSADSYFELSRIYLIKGDKQKAIDYANAAIDSNPKKIVKRIDKDQLFITIKAKLSIPFNLNSLDENEEEKENSVFEKEKIAKEHLEDTFDITRHLSYGDIIASVNKEKETMEKLKEEKKDKETEKIEENKNEKINNKEILTIEDAIKQNEQKEKTE